MRHGLIFDLDGTLVDSLPGIRASLNRSLNAHDLLSHSLTSVRGFVGDGSRVLVTRAAPVNAEIELLDSLEAHFKADYDSTWPEGTFPYPGISEMLIALQAKGYALSVLSNKPHPFTTAIVGSIFPEILFTEVQGQISGVPHKPDPSGALWICKRIGLGPGDFTFVGDSTIDLETARRAGMRSIAVSWGYHDREILRSQNPYAMADIPSDVVNALKKFC